MRVPLSILPPFSSLFDTLKPLLRSHFAGLTNTNDHKLLKNSLERLQKPWILSYHDHELVQELYIQEGSLESVSLEMQWVADRAKKGTELIISNLPLIRAQRTLWTVSTDGPNGLKPLLTGEREKTLVPEGD